MIARRQPRRAVSPRLHGDEGAIIIELAFVAPLMVTLLLGIFEFGTLFRNENILANAVRAAARVESQQANTATVDQLAIKTFMASTTGLKNMTLKAIIVYEAPSGGQPSTACRSLAPPTGSPPYGRSGPLASSGFCNVYSLAQAQAVAADTTGSTNADFGCATSSTWDSNWCPNAANRPTTPLTVPMTQVGVWAQYTYTDVTRLFPVGTMTVSDFAIFAIQPTT